MTQTAEPAASAGAEPERSPGLAARVSLGRVFTPVSTEFALIASTAVLLTIFGLVMVLSATSATAAAAGEGPYDGLLRQGIFAVVGLPLMFLLSRAPVTFLRRIAWPALIGALLLQLLVFTPLGVDNDGNRNWIHIGSFNLQPSEFLKLALALWIAAVLARKHAYLGDWRHVWIPVVPVSVLAMGSVIAGKDLGTTMILALVVMGALFFAGVRLRVFVIPAILAVAGVIAYAVSSTNRMERILSVFDDDCDYYGTCYQVMHGIWGMAGGGIFGLGLGNSQEKYGWLPAAANDYIFAILGEELGLIGAVVVLALFTLYTVGAFHIIRKTRDPFIRVAAGGITVWIIGQALINIGVVLRLFPPMGVPLPFMSQGGTSLLAVLLASGVLLAFARTIPARGAEVPVPPAIRPGRGGGRAPRSAR